MPKSAATHYCFYNFIGEVLEITSDLIKNYYDEKLVAFAAKPDVDFD